MRETRNSATENKNPIAINIIDGSRIIVKLARRNSSKLDPTMFTSVTKITDIIDMVRQR